MLMSFEQWAKDKNFKGDGFNYSADAELIAREAWLFQIKQLMDIDNYLTLIGLPQVRTAFVGSEITDLSDPEQYRRVAHACGSAMMQVHLGLSTPVDLKALDNFEQINVKDL